MNLKFLQLPQGTKIGFQIKQTFWPIIELDLKHFESLTKPLKFRTLFRPVKKFLKCDYAVSFCGQRASKLQAL